MKALLALALVFCSVYTFSQERVLTFGLELKPMLPGDYFRAGRAEVTEANLDLSLTNKIGYSAGMLIRYGLTKAWSLESGISFVRRNYELSIVDNDINFEGLSRFSIIGYEIPTRALVYVRLSDKIYMNAAFGLSFNFYPSDVASSGDYFEHISRRKSWIQTAGIANLGWDYRTEESGTFYFGASFHRPLSNMYLSRVRYLTDSYFTDMTTELNAAYLTFDFRYFFHEEPLKKERKKKEPNKLRQFRKMQKDREKQERRAK